MNKEEFLKEFLNFLKISNKPSVQRFTYVLERFLMLKAYTNGKEGEYYYDPAIPLEHLFVFPEVKDKEISLNEWGVFIQQCLDNAQCKVLDKIKIVKNGNVCVSTIELQMLDDLISMLNDKGILTGIHIDYKHSKSDEISWFEVKLSISSENNFKQLIKPKYQNDETVLMHFNDSHQSCFNQLIVVFLDTTLRNKGTVADPHKLCFTVAPIVPENEYCEPMFVSYNFEDNIIKNHGVPYLDISEEIRKNSLFMQINRYFISYLIDEYDLEHVLNQNILDLYYSY